MSNPKGFSRHWLLAGTILTSLAIGLPAIAQDNSTPAPAGTEKTAPPKPVAKVPAAAADTQEVVITGSRLRKNEFNSPSPVQVITAEKSSLSGMVSATEVLQSSSVANGSGQINNTFTGYVVNGGDGVNSISLRGLGSQRTLVLLNGRRLPPAGVGGTVAAVDLNTLPESVISRYEILKDGASSIYGSDAVAGVVNGITRKNFDGLELNTTLKPSEHKGGDQYEADLMWGKTFDKGHIMVSVSHYELKELTQGDRAAFSCPMNNYVGANGQNADLIDPNTGTYKCYGGATNGYVGTYFAKDYWQLLSDYGISNYYGSRAITPNTPCTPNNFDGCATNWAFIPYQNRDLNDKRLQNSTIISPVQTNTLFSEGSYRPDWAGGTEFYSELLLTQRKSEQSAWRTFFPRYNENSSANPWNQACDRYFCLPLQAEPYLAVPANSSQDVKLYRVLGGARGSWTNGWTWDAYISTSQNNGTYHDIAIPNDRVEAGTGTSQETYDLLPGGVCGAGSPTGCVPLNVFTKDILENGNWPDALKNYYFVPETGKTIYDQTIVEASATGNVFNLPAGPVAVALGVSLRRDHIKDTPGEFSRNHNVWGFSTAGVTQGTDTVKEVFGEAEFPLFKGQPFIEDMKLDTSVRYSDYDSVGSATTYKVGLDWAVDNVLRLRATAGTSFRAPGLFELFLADQTSFLSQVQVDPCINYGLKDQSGNFVQTNATIRTNCAADGLPQNFSGGGASATIIQGGGSSLKPEDSYAATFGFVLTPPDTGFKLAVDYWRIQVNNQILSTTAVVSACYSSTYFRSRPGFCDLFHRAADNSIQTIDASYRNIPTEKTGGIDFTVNYTKDFNFGTLSIDSQATYTAYDKSQTFPGDPFEDFNGTIGDPKWVGDVQSKFKHKDWTFTWTVNYVQESDNKGFAGETGSTTDIFGTPVTYRTQVPDFITHDLSVRYKAKSWQVIAGVTNLLDKTPPYIGTSAVGFGKIGNYPFSSQYYSGYIGRQYFVTISKDF
ncbi:TonB-dependent receptor plug domain-containing protein [Asticcacaulis solisilvae]|uniref:TonB-dependent receptor plug domain-containing protein n=1 Tax=Asticcacaulis solisilvae TaxID=1217274 RepID=UPI003FD8D4E2